MHFLWGCEEVRKITWIKWDTVCLRTEHRGLDVRRLKEFNLALWASGGGGSYMSRGVCGIRFYVLAKKTKGAVM
jgi:hypothetical protein